MTIQLAEVDALALRRLKQELTDAGYTRDAIRSALRTDQHLTAQPGEVLVFERRLAGHGPLETLIRFFLIGSTVEAADLAASLPSLRSAELEHMGLVEAAEGGVRCPIRIVPHGDVVLACDRSYYKDEDSLEANVVTGVTNPATLLADLTIRKHVRRALDLGTGGGIQALLLANHCEEVVATDVNPRAIDFTNMNAAMNGFANIESRVGSWFEPVEGEFFDIITVNPPYVISPDSNFLYRDSGMPADTLCRHLVREMPRFLNDAGFGHILVSWALRSGEEWSEPIRSWVEGLPCDVWLLHYLTEDSLTQAAKWNIPLVSKSLDAYGAAIDRWTDYYRDAGIVQVAFGAVVMRRRSSGTPWVRADSFHGARGSSGAVVQRVFGAQDFLESIPDDRRLLDVRFTLVPTHQLDQRLVARNGVWQLDEATLTLTEGLAFRGGLDVPSAQILQHLDGRHTLRQAVDASTRELGLTEVDRRALTETALAMTRRLYELGFLVRATADGPWGAKRTVRA